MVMLSEILTLLATGEFSNIALSRNDSNTIDESEYAKVIGHINLGLVEIYKRFNLLENEVVLHAIPGVTRYEIHPGHLASGCNLNTERGFYLEHEDDRDLTINIVEIVDVRDSSDNQLTLNNRRLTPAILQIAPDVLRIGKILAPEKFTVIYQAFPAPIVVDEDLDPEDLSLPIPHTIIEALLFYVASRVYKPMGANDSTVNADKSAGYQQQYELSCMKLDALGLENDSDNTIDRFTEGGWA